VHPPCSPELSVVDAADFAAGRCTPFVDLDTEDGRLATFRSKWRVSSHGVHVSFPKQRLKPLTPKMLAKAGFLYCPDDKHADRCVCFCCNRALHTWDTADNPLYEHCRVNPECPFVQAAVSDDIDDMPKGKSPQKVSAPLLGGKASSDKSDTVPQGWTLQHGCTWPKDTVIDHLLICVNGVQIKGNALNEYVETMRKNSAYVAGKYMDDRPMMMAVDAIDWHTLVEGVPKKTMDQIMLNSVRVIRELCDDMTRDVMYYTSNVYKYAILDAVAKLLNDKYHEYVATYPKFTGKVSLFCHSLGSVITFDLLWNQLEAKAAAARLRETATCASAAASAAAAAESPTPSCSSATARADSEGGASAAHSQSAPTSPPTAPAATSSAGGGGGGGGEGGARLQREAFRRGAALHHACAAATEAAWVWPLLHFEVDNLFAVGSPIAMFLTVRGDILNEAWPRGSINFTLPGGTKVRCFPFFFCT